MIADIDKDGAFFPSLHRFTQLHQCHPLRWCVICLTLTHSRDTCVATTSGLDTEP